MFDTFLNHSPTRDTSQDIHHICHIDPIRPWHLQSSTSSTSFQVLELTGCVKPVKCSPLKIEPCERDNLAAGHVRKTGQDSPRDVAETKTLAFFCGKILEIRSSKLVFSMDCDFAPWKSAGKCVLYCYCSTNQILRPKQSSSRKSGKIRALPIASP